MPEVYYECSTSGFSVLQARNPSIKISFSLSKATPIQCFSPVVFLQKNKRKVERFGFDQAQTSRPFFFCTLNSEKVNSASESINGNSFSENSEIIELNIGSVFSETSASGEVESVVKNGDAKERLQIMLFLIGVFARLKSGFENIQYSDWLSWWPFWRQEKRLERLIADADANPEDAP